MHNLQKMQRSKIGASVEALMKSDITLKGTLVATIVVFASLAHAQDGPEVIVSIPFNFSVNHLHFEAGSYKFSLASDAFGMSVINLKTGNKQYITVTLQNSFLPPELGFLVFSRTGGNSYLSEVHFSGTAGFSKLATQ